MRAAAALGMLVGFASTAGGQTGRLVAPAAGGWQWSPSFQERGAALVAAAVSPDRYALGEALLNDPWFAPGLKRHPDRQQWVSGLVNSNLRSFALDESLVRALDPPALARLGDLKVPTLVIDPELDHADLHAIADSLGKYPLVRVQRITGAGHMVHLEQPGPFAEAVKAFLR